MGKLPARFLGEAKHAINRQAAVVGNGTFAVTFGAYGTDGATIKTAAIA